MTTLPNMGLVLPTRGAPGSGSWGDTVDANYAKQDAHDHTTGKGLPIPSSGLNINADIPFSSLYAPTQLHRLQFSSITALSSGAQNKSIFVNASDNELYWRSNAGNNVKLTAGSALNVAAFTGGIGGDYTSVSAAVGFDDSNKRYTFKDGSGNWARIAAGELRAYPTGGATSFYVGHAAPGGMAASYTLTYPAALPAATQTAQVDTSGVVTFASVPKHGAMTLSIQGSAFQCGSGQTFTYANQGIVFNANTATSPINLPIGARITAVRMYVIDSATGPTKLKSDLWSLTSSGTATNLGTSSTSAGSGANQTLTISSLTTTVASLTGYAVVASVTTGSANVEIYLVEVDYDRP